MRAQTGLAGIVVSLSLVTAACSGTEDAVPTGSSVASSSSSGASTSPSGLVDATPSDDASPTEVSSVTPAVGRTVETYSMTFTAPEDFSKGTAVGNGLASTTQLNSVTCACSIFAGGLGNLSSEDFEGAAELVEDDGKRQPDREVGGEQVYVFTTEDASSTSYRIGRVAGDQIASFEMKFSTLGSVRPEDATAASDQALVESILATVVWKA